MTLMTLDEFEKLLVEIQNNTFQAKILQAVYTLAKHVTTLGDAIVEVQNKLNQLITEMNELKEKQKEKEINEQESEEKEEE